MQVRTPTLRTKLLKIALSSALVGLGGYCGYFLPHAIEGESSFPSRPHSSGATTVAAQTYASARGAGNAVPTAITTAAIAGLGAWPCYMLGMDALMVRRIIGLSLTAGLRHCHQEDPARRRLAPPLPLRRDLPSWRGCAGLLRVRGGG